MREIESEDEKGVIPEDHPARKLARKKEILVKGFLAGKVRRFLIRHSRILDDYFRNVYESSSIGPLLCVEKNPYAVVALGGYGRQEQCIHSDVDLVFIFRDKVPEKADALVREMIYPLWDNGYHAAHAVRCLEDRKSFSHNRMELLVPFLDSRLVCGNSSVFCEWNHYLREKVISVHSAEIMSELAEISAERHRRFGDSTYRLEPNLKEGQGGLRDYHTMLWIGRVKAGLREPRDLEYFGCLSHDEYRNLTEALSLIWYIRNHLHNLAGRKFDNLHFRYQEILAEAMGYSLKNGQQPVEGFLGALHDRMNFVKQHFLMMLYELGLVENRKRKPRQKIKTRYEGLEVGKAMLRFTGPEKILESPLLLIRIFEESARCKLPLSAEARRLVRDFLHIVDARFRSDKNAVKSFEKILLTPIPTFNVLSEMLDTGFLSRFIPEFEGIVNRIQYDEYHLYPVHKHSLRTVKTLKLFGKKAGGGELYGTLYDGLKNKVLLLWAALLHDIGKKEAGGGHSEKGVPIVRAVLTEKGYRPDQTDTVCFLVAEHLLLVKTATRRDLQDEETAVFCARKIKDPERLHMLYLLSVADSMATGPKAWNDWTESLLRELFLNVSQILEKGELASSEAVETVDAKKKQVLAAAGSPDEKAFVEKILDRMSPRYLLYVSPEKMNTHIDLYRGLGDRPFVWKIDEDQGVDTRTVTICAKDAPGLFSRFAGIFTLNDIDILDVQVYTWHNRVALDIFTVRPPPDRILEKEKWEKASEELSAALYGRLDLGAALIEKKIAYAPVLSGPGKRPHRVEIDNTTSSFFTIVEVFTYDFPGLLYRITDALFNCGLDIRVAKIATNADQVVDVFYVRTLEGQKAGSPEREADIRAALLAVLPEIPARR